MLNHPPGVSARIGVILDVLETIRLARPTCLNEVAQERIDAERDIRLHRNYRSRTTVFDACCRQLGLTTINQFDDLVLKWLVANQDERLKNLLSAHAAHARRADLDAISRFFQGPPPPPDPPVNRVEAPTPDRTRETTMGTTQLDTAVRDLNSAIEDLLDSLNDAFMQSYTASDDRLSPFVAKLAMRHWVAMALRQSELRVQICEHVLQAFRESLRKEAPAPPAPLGRYPD